MALLSGAKQGTSSSAAVRAQRARARQPLLRAGRATVARRSPPLRGGLSRSRPRSVT